MTKEQRYREALQSIAVMEKLYCTCNANYHRDNGDFPTCPVYICRQALAEPTATITEPKCAACGLPKSAKDHDMPFVDGGFTHAFVSSVPKFAWRFAFGIQCELPESHKIHSHHSQAKFHPFVPPITACPKCGKEYKTEPVHKDANYCVCHLVPAPQPAKSADGERCVCGHPKVSHSPQGCVICLFEDPKGDICYCFEVQAGLEFHTKREA